MNEPDAPKKTMPPTEWVLADMDDARRSLWGMMKLRRINREGLANRLGGRNLFSPFLSGKQKNVHLQSMIDAADAMDCEVVIRPRRGNKMAARIKAVKQERGVLTEAGREPTPVDAFDEVVSPDDPDREHKLKLLSGMRDPKNRADLVKIFQELRDMESAASGGV